MGKNTNGRIKGKGKSLNNKQISIFCNLFFCLLYCPAVLAEDLSVQLGQLEVRFFQHQYSQDSTEERLSRLEKLIYGGVKNGLADKRLNDLFTLIPAIKLPTAQHTTIGSQNIKTDETAGSVDDTSSYPAVTAIEKRLLGHEYSQEPLAQRLDRLEIKLYGRSSSSSDLEDRVEQLKQATGVDIARQIPSGSDWVEDDEMDYIPVRPSPLSSATDEDGKSFSGYDLRQDMQQSFGAKQPGVARTTSNQNVGAITPFTSSSKKLTQPLHSLGMSQQVSALEKEIFGKAYLRESLPVRLNRLETTVFPGKPPCTGKPLPERVNQLLAVIPLSSSNQDPRNSSDMDFDQDNFGALTSMKSGGNSISKILSSMSRFLSNGNSRSSKKMPTDPQTGLLVDPSTGNLIDPDTGVVVGQSPGFGSNVNAYGLGTIGSFNSGFAPSSVAPYGFAGGNGVRFGFGGIGRYGLGGWP